MSGIYTITNCSNSKVYVGSSNNIDRRWKQHIYALKKNTHYNHHLQCSWNKYGSEAFKFEIVEECPVSVLIEREGYWLSTVPETLSYNVAQIVEGVVCHSEETRLKMSKAHKDKAYSRKGQGARSWTFTNPKGERVEIFNLKQFCRENNLHMGSMSAIAAGKRNSHSGWKACA